MRRISWGVWSLAALVLLSGAALSACLNLRGGAEAVLPGMARDLRGAGSPAALATAALAVLSTLGALLLARAPDRGPTAPPLARRPALSPMEVGNPEVEAVVRQSLLELGEHLARFTQGKEPDMIPFVQDLLEGAVRVGASDVHVHPLETGTRIAFRVQGGLEEVLTLARQHHPRLINRIKVLSKLTLYTLDKPQDGHFPFHTSEGPADIRVSILPTNHGPAVALRIARHQVRLPQLSALGFPDGILAKFQQILALPQGVVIVAGATGSGKTTSLYASLGHIKETRGALTRVATIEDPIEFDVPLFSQTQVNVEQGFTFAHGLRSVLRQDPNVIMVGEVRDAETARTAIQAGLSGHLLLTTLHANSAAGVFSRLIEIGVEPFLLASATVVSLSQRLVRLLCKRCRAPEMHDPGDLMRLDAMGIQPGRFQRALGCEACRNTGYLGRTAIYEMLNVTPAIRSAVNGKLPTDQIQDLAVKEGMVTLLKAGVTLAETGATSLREVFRVVGD